MSRACQPVGGAARERAHIGKTGRIRPLKPRPDDSSKGKWHVGTFLAACGATAPMASLGRQDSVGGVLCVEALTRRGAASPRGPDLVRKRSATVENRRAEASGSNVANMRLRSSDAWGANGSTAATAAGSPRRIGRLIHFRDPDFGSPRSRCRQLDRAPTRATAIRPFASDLALPCRMPSRVVLSSRLTSLRTTQP